MATARGTGSEYRTRGTQDLGPLPRTGTLISTARRSFDWSALKTYLPAVVCGPWLGIWMSQIAYRHTQLAIAITLTCTTPLFVTPILRIVYGYRITVRGILGAVVALVGVYLTVAG